MAREGGPSRNRNSEFGGDTARAPAFGVYWIARVLFRPWAMTIEGPRRAGQSGKRGNRLASAGIGMRLTFIAMARKV